MKICEIREDIRDTSVTRDIFDISKISQQLALYSEFITEINFSDYEYISILLNKSKTMLCTINFIFEHYMKTIDKI